jgi:hypothetical protein
MVCPVVLVFISSCRTQQNISAPHLRCTSKMVSWNSPWKIRYGRVKVRTTALAAVCHPEFRHHLPAVSVTWESSTRAANFKLSLLKKLDKYAIFLLLCNCCTQLPIVLLSEHKQWLYMPQLFFFILSDALLYWWTFDHYFKNENGWIQNILLTFSNIKRVTSSLPTLFYQGYLQYRTAHYAPTKTNFTWCLTG